MLNKLTNTIFLAILCSVLHAQTAPVLLKDINTGINSVYLTEAIASIGFNGYAISSGTYQGTNNRLWKITATGAVSLLSAEVYQPNNFVEFNGAVYFFASKYGTAIFGLWKTDGTTAGTVFIKQLDYSSYELVKAGSLLYFRSSDAVNGSELWKSNGTAAGTVLVKDIIAGIDGSAPYRLTAFGTKLLFWSVDVPTSLNTMSLYSSDGTAVGTIKLKSFGLDNYPAIEVAGTNAFFTAKTATYGLELWKTNGTANGTVLVRDINAGTANSTPYYFKALGTQVVFYANDAANGTEVWRSDGTSAGTVRIKETGGLDGIPTVSGGNIPAVISPILELGGKLWFFYVTNSGAGYQIQVCTTTGTAASTYVVYTFNTLEPGIGYDPMLVYAKFLGAVNGQMAWCFRNTNSTANFQLWKSDGTTSTMFHSGVSELSLAYPSFTSGTSVYFVQTNPNVNLWTTNGTNAGTISVGGQLFKSSNLFDYAAVGSRTYFLAEEALAGYQTSPYKAVWSTSGTAATTVPSIETTGTTFFSNIASLNTQGMYIKYDQTNYGLYKVTETNTVPQLVGSTWTGGYTNLDNTITAHKNKIFFSKNGAIWQTDGTSGGTTLYYTPPPTNDVNYANYITQMVSNGDSLYFMMIHQHLTGPYTSGDLWSISGNAGDPGTKRVADAYVATNGGGGFYGKLASLSTVNGKAVLTMSTVTGGAGNNILGPIAIFVPGYAQISSGSTVNGGTLNSYPAVINNKLFVLLNQDQKTISNTIAYNKALWGSANSTSSVLIKKFASQANGVGNYIAGFGTTAFFAANDSTGKGQELWKSDFTTGGTVMVKDINVGSGDSYIGPIVTDGSKVYFSTFDGTNWGIWASDGSSAGTVKLTNFTTSLANPNFASFFINQNTLYFTADNGAIGGELWALSLQSAPPPPPPPTTCTNNLLTNPGFESDLASWEGSGMVIATAPDVASGTKSLKLCTAGNSARQTINGTPGLTYSLAWNIKTAGTNQNILVGLKFLSSSWQVLGNEYTSFDSPGAFSSGTISKLAPAGTAKVEVSFNKQNSGCIYVDDVCLTTGSTGGGPCAPDVTKPIFASCPANISVSTAGTSAVATWLAPVATDNCPGTVTLTSTHQSGASFPLGTTTVTYTAKDQANNTATCSFTVTVSQSGGGGGGTGADLEVTITADKTTVPQWGNVTYTIKAKNNGTTAISSATIMVVGCEGGVQKLFDQAFKLVYAGTPGAPTLGTYNLITQQWQLSNLAPAQTAVLTVGLFTTGTAEKKVIAYSSAQAPSDPDSQPSATVPANCTPAQDDEALWTINAGQSLLVAGDDRWGSLDPTSLESYQVFPNPAGDAAFVKLPVGNGQTSIAILNQMGILQKEFVFENLDLVELDLSDISNGMYFIKIEQKGQRTQIKKLAVSRLY